MSWQLGHSISWSTDRLLILFSFFISLRRTGSFSTSVSSLLLPLDMPILFVIIIACIIEWNTNEGGGEVGLYRLGIVNKSFCRICIVWKCSLLFPWAIFTIKLFLISIFLWNLGKRIRPYGKGLVLSYKVVTTKQRVEAMKTLYYYYILLWLDSISFLHWYV